MNHQPILKNQIIELLNINEKGIYVDCTLGSGGHSKAILNRLNKHGKLISIDYDQNITRYFSKNNKNESWIIINDNFKNIDSIFASLKIDKVDGIFMDLGYSQDQLENLDYGLQFKQNSKLNMKIDSQAKVSAYDIVNKYPEDKLIFIFRTYGEERFAQRIARNIIKNRQIKRIINTLELVTIIKNSIPKKYQSHKHPAKKVFQALRIYVNSELHNLAIFLDKTPVLLAVGGRLLIISFHSLEDRLIKTKFNTITNNNIENNKTPIIIKKKKEFISINKKAITASVEEIEKNPKARSAKLRGVIKL